MKITIDIPTKEEILKHEAIAVPVAKEKESWSIDSVGNYANQQGIYVHFRGNEILYVGQTTEDSAWGNFGERLRREFQASSSQKSLLYEKLAEKPTENRTVFFPLEEIEKMVSITGETTSERKALLIEQAMIAAYSPTVNKR